MPLICLQQIKRSAAGVFAGLLLFHAGRPVAAQTIDDAITSSPGVTYSILGGNILPIFGGNPLAPAFFDVGNFSGQTVLYDVEVDLTGVYSTSPAPPITTGALIDIANSSGGIVVDSFAALLYTSAPASPNLDVGNAALRAVSRPLGVSGNRRDNGDDVQISHSDGQIAVTGNGTRNPGGTTLGPSGFRMADLNGILALSYGKQGTSNDTAHPSGTATVYVNNALIQMSQTDPTIVTAGVSAVTMTGVGDAFDTVNYTASANVTLNATSVTNSAGSGAGVIATGTGGRLIAGGSSTAVGNDVSVTLNNSSIAMTGDTGIGVLATSVVYMPGEAAKSNASQAGQVSVTLEGAQSAISTGSAGAKYAIGVLAVSAGTAAFLDPFGTYDTQGTGVGRANSVTITSSGNVSTTGKTSIGLAGLSLGGPATVATNSSNGTTYLGMASGEANGEGNSVTITTNEGAAVTTVGESAHGIVALSAGSGGILINEQEAVGDATNPGAATGLAVGANTSSGGGAASPGGTVTVTNNGSVFVGDGNGNGVNATGILAQSIGGGGGSASGHAALFVGDKGGKGGNGGDVTVNVGSAGSVRTRDDLSAAILAQSIGGGGGKGGNASGIFVAVGGKGGDGGLGGTVTLGLDGSVQTGGMHSAGVVGQSIGGGGGDGGTGRSVGLVINTGIGGRAANGSPGGTVTANISSTGSITTAQNNSSALVLQSVGGGGGTGGAAVSQSISLGLGISFALGGDGGGGGAGGNATATNNGTITTGTAPTNGTGAPNLDGADSFGMLVQSIGGGGGHAGAATAKDLVFQLPTEDVETPGGVAVAVSVAVGGSGGSGGTAAQAALTNSGTITTWGDGSSAMVGQSIGGGGGHGGDSTASSLLLALTGYEASMNVAVGGSGGSGGHGGAVVATNNGGATITTHGQNAAGISAQSIGGGGGIGSIGTGNANDPTLSPLSVNSYTITAGVGGAGGSGGHAGYTNVQNQGAITTSGSGSDGILAQSVGGGGGHAKGGGADGSNNNITFNLALGMSGGDGGSAVTTLNNGYSVSANNTGAIQTSGGDASGILAQSIGGGGGKGGSSDAEAHIGTWSALTNVIFSGGLTPRITLGASAAGSGGNGGAGGNVLVTHSGSIGTAGSRSYGIVAQSISGGGGMGGHASAQSNPGLFDGYDGSLNFDTEVYVGGYGGDASNAGLVNVNTNGTVTTSGYGSHAIVAQSVAGGGGVGGDGTSDIRSTIGFGIGVSRNATTGTASASGGNVTVSPGANITTTGANAFGIVAHSIGGGGGIGTVGAMPSFATASYSAGVLPLRQDVTMGFNQNNSGASNGGQVTVNPANLLQTSGDWSLGVVAQSVGAGGGKGDTITGTNSNASSDLAVQLGASRGRGDGSAVNVSFAGGTIFTGIVGPNPTGYGATGIVAQSIGGGGGLFTDGSSGASGNITLGVSSGEAKGAGGAVTVSGDEGLVQTRGDYAFGVVAQSIGGGGGIAGSGSTQTYQGTGTPGVNLQVGSNNGDGTGSTVTYNADALIETSGRNAFGIVAQSIGGGGGIAFAKTSTPFYGLGMTNATLSSDHYDGGAVNVTVANFSAVTTAGAGAHGIIAQSIGGGGGIVAPDSSGGLSTTRTAINGLASALGYGGTVTVNLGGEVLTTGAGAFGIIAQTISGGGGLFNVWAGSTGGSSASGGVNSGNQADNVNVTLDAGSRINATGVGATGLLAQNMTAGNFNAGRVSVTVGGNVTGGSGGQAYGVWIDSGTDANTLTVTSGGRISAASGQAVHYTGTARLAVANAGTIEGSLLLNGTSTVSNTGTIRNASAIVGAVTNNGTLSLLDSPMRLTITGNLTQNAGADVQLGIAGAASFSSISVTGVADYRAGGLQIAFSYLPDLGASFTLLEAGTGTYDFTYVQVTGLPLGADWTTAKVGENFVLEITAVPEPAAVGALFGGALFLVALSRHRRRSRLETPVSRPR